MINTITLKDIINSIHESTPFLDGNISRNFENEFLEHCFQDLFQLTLKRTSPTSLLSEVQLGKSHSGVEDLIKNYSLGEHREDLLGTTERVGNLIFEGAVGYEFSTQYLSPVRHKNIKVLRVHESDNEAKDRRIDRERNIGATIAAIIGGAVPNFGSSFLSRRVIAPGQDWYDILQSTAFWAACGGVAYWVLSYYTTKASQSKRKEYTRTRDFLGKEEIISDESVLDENNHYLRPSIGNYNGMFYSYSLSKSLIDRISGRKISLKLKDWKEAKDEPLFLLELSESSHSDIVGLTELQIKFRRGLARLDIGQGFSKDKPFIEPEEISLKPKFHYYIL